MSVEMPVRARSWSIAKGPHWWTLAGGAAAATALVVRDPHQHGSWGVCPLHAITGIYCPGCGSLRGVNDLMTGHPLAAIGSNALLLPALAWLGWWWLHEAGTVVAGRRIGEPPRSAAFCWTLVALVAVFVVVRNLPGSPLAP